MSQDRSPFLTRVSKAHSWPIPEWQAAPGYPTLGFEGRNKAQISSWVSKALLSVLICRQFFLAFYPKFPSLNLASLIPTKAPDDLRDAAQPSHPRILLNASCLNFQRCLSFFLAINSSSSCCPHPGRAVSRAVRNFCSFLFLSWCTNLCSPCMALSALVLIGLCSAASELTQPHTIGWVNCWPQGFQQRTERQYCWLDIGLLGPCLFPH